MRFEIGKMLKKREKEERKIGEKKYDIFDNLKRSRIILILLYLVVIDLDRLINYPRKISFIAFGLSF